MAPLVILIRCLKGKKALGVFFTRFCLCFFYVLVSAFHHQLPCVANDDTIGVKHWHNLEDKAVSEGTCHLGAPWLSSYEDQLSIERKQSLQHR